MLLCFYFIIFVCLLRNCNNNPSVAFIAKAAMDKDQVKQNNTIVILSKITSDSTVLR